MCNAICNGNSDYLQYNNRGSTVVPIYNVFKNSMKIKFPKDLKLGTSERQSTDENSWKTRIYTYYTQYQFSMKINFVFLLFIIHMIQKYGINNRKHL